MKLNNKGFAVSTILYGVLTLTILILMIIFGILKSNKDMNEDLVENLTDSMNSCVHIESKLESCYFNNEDCDYIKQLYTECIQNKGKNLGLLVDKILLDNNGGKKDDGIDFSKISSDTNGNGLYYTNKNTENNNTTYYFRGTVENNYVKFGKDSSGNYIIWRIVRINEDGSVRLITEESIGNSKFNSSYRDNAYVGYMYGTIGSNTYALTHANTNNSTIKVFIDNWYKNNLIDYSSYLDDAGFCNDRSLANATTYLGYGQNVTYYGADNRYGRSAQLVSNGSTLTPQFACPQPNDLFTLKESNKGNKSLDYPIGMITADEVIYSGAVYGQTYNTSMYLTNGDGFLTITPMSLFQSTLTGEIAVHMFFVGDKGNLGYLYAGDANYTVRPVINLKIDVEAIGNGTISNPYVIKTN